MIWRLRQYFRKRMPGMTPEIAADRKSKLAFAYSFIAWNLFGLTLYMLLKEKFPKLNNSVHYAKLLGIKEATVIEYSNFSKVNEYQINLKDSEIEEFHGNTIKDEEKDNQEKQVDFE